MKRLGSFVAALCLLAGAASAADVPVRRTLVLYSGQRLIHTSSGSIITVNTPPDAPRDIIRTGFEQYGQNIAIEALKPGDIKVLLEFTNSKIGEIINVVVTDKKTFDRYRLAAGALGGVEGLGPDSVQAAGSRVLVTGTVYSAGDLGRCLDLERTGGKTADMPNIVCAARMSSAATAVYPQSEYRAQASAEMSEIATRLAGAATEGMEGSSRWTTRLFVGDVPVAILTSPNRADLVQKAAQFCNRFNRGASEWKRRAAKSGVPFPVSFSVTPAGSRLQLGMVSRADQGSRGETLLDISRDDIDPGIAASVGGPDRILSWWTSILEDSFALYFMARRPTHPDSPLLALYNSSLRLSPKFERDTAAVSVARGYYSMKFSTGSDPFDGLLTRLPSGFTGH